MNRDQRRKLVNICLFLLALLIAQEAILLVFDRKESVTAKLQNKWRYSSAIKEGLKYYTPKNLEKIKIDEYFLLKEIKRKEDKVDLPDLSAKYKADPLKRILNKEDYVPDLYFDRSGFGKNPRHPANNPLYELSSPYDLFLEEPWDDVVLRSLYCDISGYDDTDFSILKSVKSGDGGYWDTHVLLSLIILRENKCYDSEKIEEQLRQLAEEIITVQQNDRIFSDLYAERIVFLYWAGYGDAVQKEWADMARDNLTEDPGWRRENAFSSNAHTTGLALLSLIYYQEGESKQSFYPHTKTP